jgi:hypothetical protein
MGSPVALDDGEVAQTYRVLTIPTELLKHGGDRQAYYRKGNRRQTGGALQVGIEP